MLPLWTPPGSDRSFNPHNPFDVMALYQEQIVEATTTDRRRELAKAALLTLKMHFQSLDCSFSDTTVVSDIAVMPDEDEEDSCLVLQDLGTKGRLTGIRYMTLGDTEPGLALCMDTKEIFSVQNPAERDPLGKRTETPITAVRYIELAA